MCHLRRRERVCRVCDRRIFVTMDRKKCFEVKFALSKQNRHWASCLRNDPVTFKTELGTCSSCAFPVGLKR